MALICLKDCGLNRQQRLRQRLHVCITETLRKVCARCLCVMETRWSLCLSQDVPAWVADSWSPNLYQLRMDELRVETLSVQVAFIQEGRQRGTLCWSIQCRLPVQYLACLVWICVSCAVRVLHGLDIVGNLSCHGHNRLLKFVLVCLQDLPGNQE